jgi:hypothetical protein
LRGIEVIWGLDKNSGQPRRLKPQIIARRSGTTWEKLFCGRKFTSAAKSREAKQSTYRSAEALRHPKAAIPWSFSATREVAPFPNRSKMT